MAVPADQRNDQSFSALEIDKDVINIKSKCDRWLRTFYREIVITECRWRAHCLFDVYDCEFEYWS